MHPYLKYIQTSILTSLLPLPSRTHEKVGKHRREKGSNARSFSLSDLEYVANSPYLSPRQVSYRTVYLYQAQSGR